MAVRQSNARWGILAAALLGFVGCTTTDAGGPGAPRASAPPPPPKEDPAARQAFIARMQLKFPSSAYLVGFGSGSSAADAEDNAKVRAAETISSQIQANLHDYVSEATKDGRTTSGTVVSQDIVQKVTTDAGAFIHPHPELTTQIGDVYEAVAVVSREELDGKYARDSEQLLSKLLVAWDAALKGRSGPIQAITEALCESRSYEAKLDAMDSERWLVAGRGVWTDEAKSRRQQIQELRQQLESTRVSIVRIAEPAGLDEQISKAVTRSGFATELVERPDCQTGGLVLALEKQSSCGNTMLGIRCETRLVATANRCNENESLFSESSNPGVGMNASEQDVAARASLKAVDVSGFVKTVATRVRKAIEGECQK